MIPSAPTGMLGAIQYVKGERLQRLKVPLSQVVACVQSYGVGSRSLFTAARPGRGPGGDESAQ